MEEYVSYEQIVSAAIACYKNYLSTAEIAELVMELKCAFPNMVIINDGIRKTQKYIYCLRGSAALNPRYSLDTNIIVDGRTIMLKDYLCAFAGNDLVSFMENKKNMLEDSEPKM